MKRVTASEARRNWFRILDEVAGGAVVVVERGGRRIVLRREEASSRADDLPDYGALIQAPEADAADRWGWTWSPEAPDLTPEDADGEEADGVDEGPRRTGRRSSEP
jgi:hypothetical protein